MSELRSSIYRFIATATQLVNQNRGETTYEAAAELHDATVDAILDTLLQALPEEETIDRLDELNKHLDSRNQQHWHSYNLGYIDCLIEVKHILNEARESHE